MNEEKKKEQADEIVSSLDELFPEDSEAEVQPQDVSAQNSHRSQGGEVGVSVYDENDNEKQNVEYIRVPGKGSVEAYKLDSGKWAVTRRDKLPHNKEDKLGKDK